MYNPAMFEVQKSYPLFKCEKKRQITEVYNNEFNKVFDLK